MTMANEREQDERTCPKDCRKCGFQQHAYCSAQMAYATLTIVQSLVSRIDALEKSIGASSDLIDPAQVGSGADE